MVWARGPLKGAIAAMILCGLASNVRAERLVVADVTPAGDEGGAMTVLLRSLFAEGKRPTVPLPEVLRALHKVDGMRDRVALRPGEEERVLGELGADRLLTVELAQDGGQLTARYKIYLRTGSVLSAGKASAKRGDYHLLARTIARSASALLGTEPGPELKVTLEELRPFARALAKYSAGDLSAALSELSSADPAVSEPLPAARELADELARSPKLPEADRIVAARLAHDDELARQLGGKAKTPAGRAEHARTLAEAGDEAGAEAALKKIKNAGDPTASLARAEIALKQGDSAAAEAALSPLISKRPPDPKALALVATMPPNTLSKEGEAQVLAAAKAATNAGAGVAARLGTRAVSGGDKEGAALMKMDTVPAYQMKEMMAELAQDLPPEIVEEEMKRGSKPGPGGAGGKGGVGADGKGDGKGDGKSGPPSLLADEQKSDSNPASDAMAELLSQVSNLTGHPGEHVVLISLPGGAPLTPFLPRRSLVGSALRRVLSSAPYQLFVQELPAPDGPLTKAALLTIAAKQSPPAVAVVAYQVTMTDDTFERSATLRLLALDTATESVKELSGGLDAARCGAYPNPLWLVGLLAVLALIGGSIYMTLFRSGEVVVDLKRDASAETSVVHLLVSRESKPPKIEDPAEFLKREQARPPKTTRYKRTHAVSKVEFQHIPAGRWYVHAYGVSVRSGELTILPDALTQLITVEARGTTQVDIDLDPKLAECRVRVDDNGPIAEAKVWLEARADQVLTTASDGRVTFMLTTGTHQVICEHGGERFQVEIGVLSTKVQNVVIDLPRERQRKKLEAGLAIVGEEQPAFAGGDDPVAQYRSAPKEEEASPYLSSLDEVSMPDSIALPSMGPPEVSIAAIKASMPELLGRYQRSTELGRGAMGVVYKGRDTKLERDIAIKVVSDEVRRNADALAMFQQEAKAMAALNHPNLVTVFDQGETGGELFMVMELVEGRTVEKLVTERGGALNLGEVIDIADQLCAGLQYAHTRRILHRDIKPANIFYSTDKVVKLGDFGLARAIQKVRLSQTKVSGTPLYMSPEQIRGTDIDFRSDIYSVGCTIYELLTGQPPFTTGEVMYHHMYTEPDAPSARAPGLPAELDALVMRCLAKEPKARPQSAEELRQALRPLKARYAA